MESLEGDEFVSRNEEGEEGKDDQRSEEKCKE
jgi:hypothetical protein